MILIFYIQDLCRLKNMRNQMNSVVTNMVNLIQNVSQNREDKKITLEDLKHCLISPYLKIFPNTTIYATSAYHYILGYFPLIFIVYVKGNNDSTASVIWRKRIWANDKIDTYKISVDTSDNRSLINTASNVIPSKIYPTLMIKPGETKIIIECALHYSQWYKYHFTDGRPTSSVSPREAFGFHLLSSLPHTQELYFQSVIIFTPKVGLFSETPPK